jgi:hypothetical protein
MDLHGWIWDTASGDSLQPGVPSRTASRGYLKRGTGQRRSKPPDRASIAIHYGYRLIGSEPPSTGAIGVADGTRRARLH